MGRMFKSTLGKLVAIFSIVLVLVLLQGACTFNNLQSSNKSAKEILDREIPFLIADEQLVSYMANRIAEAFLCTKHLSFFCDNLPNSRANLLLIAL